MAFGWIILAIASVLTAGLGYWLASDEVQYHGPVRARYFIGGICMYAGGTVLLIWSLLEFGLDLKG